MSPEAAFGIQGRLMQGYQRHSGVSERLYPKRHIFGFSLEGTGVDQVRRQQMRRSRGETEPGGHSGKRRSLGGVLCGLEARLEGRVSPKGRTCPGAAAHPPTCWRPSRTCPARPHPDSTEQGVHGNHPDFPPDVHLLTIPAITLQLATNIRWLKNMYLTNHLPLPSPTPPWFLG